MGLLTKIRELLTANSAKSVDHQMPLPSSGGRIPDSVDADDEQFERQLEADQKLEARIVALARPHLATFARKYHQLAFVDDYGNKDVDKWYNELGYFVDKVVMLDQDVLSLLPLSIAPEFSRFMTIKKRLCMILDTYIVGHNWDYVSACEDSEYASSMGGADFERFVAAKLKKAGMEVSQTPATGDQGADLLAQNGRERIAVQCKRSGAPVGNKAVQEAAAGRGFYNATSAWVVSDAPFTKSAKQLAQRLGVHLLHHSELE